MININLSADTILLISIAVNVVLVMAIVAIYVYQKKISFNLQVANEELKNAPQIRARAEKILEDAKAKSQEIINQAVSLNSQSTQSLNQALEKATNEQIMAYKQALENGKGESVKTLNNISKDIQNAALEEVQAFKNNLQQEVAKSQLEVQKRLEADFKSVDVQVEEYKKKRLAQIEGELNQILAKVTEDLLGKSLRISDHQELVMKSLQEAKQKNVF